ncbi:MAG: type II toxin-antitoxin system HipA family toxin, partial [Polyangiaceae bacterium]
PRGSDRAGAQFFTNLLPEGATRERICARLKISVGNDFALLRAIGGECAGALSLLPEGEEPSAEPQPYEALEAERVDELVAGEGEVPLLVGGSATRLSLAGAHDKLPVFVDSRELYVPLAHAPSTHILKLPHDRHKHVPQNEALTTWLAEELGFDVPTVALHRGALLVERYDRRRGRDWAVTRLHQEDVCQATGRPPNRKYEVEGGPSLAESVELVRRVCRQPLADVRRILRWALFNVLAGNSDAHGKNLSLLYDEPVPRLAPFYDLVCTRAFPRLSRELAMAFGGESDPDRIGPPQVEALRGQLGLGKRLLPTLLDELLHDAEGALGRAIERVGRTAGDHPVLERVPPVVLERIARLRRLE